MRYIIAGILMHLILCVSGQSNFKMCSWNIANFGKSKTQDEIKFIAKTIKNFDVVSIVEVVAGTGGPEAVEALKKELNKSGNKWSYELSQPTTSIMNGAERYAVFWKNAKLTRVSKASLEQSFKKQIDREPFFVGFKVADGQTFTIASFHAVPTAKHPEKEIAILKKIPPVYPQKNIIFCGDFNLTGTDKSFDLIKSIGYETAFVDQKTSLEAECHDGDCLASVYDNVLYRTDKQTVIKKGIIPFYEDFGDFKKARKVSDHVPVWVEFGME